MPTIRANAPKGEHLMRKLKLQVQTTVDGYMGGPNGEMDWTTVPWTDDISAYVNALTEPVDCIVLGRKLAEGFIPAWAAGPEGEDQASIDWMNNTPKVVISNTLTESPWENAVVAGGDLAETVNKLKARPGGDMIAYGGSTLVSALIAKGLLDELHLFVNPTAIGAGLPVFPNLGTHQQLRLVAAQPFDCGITTLHYEPKRS
jgi:dihydrofolate reductase